MAKLILQKDTKKINLAHFFQYLNEELPSYAVPLFLRINNEAEITSTFKHKKHQLKEEGFDCAKTGKETYVLHNKTYKRVTIKTRDEINAGNYRF